MVTSLEDLKKINPEIVLPPFPDGTPFVAKVKRASLINMLAEGRIANPLVKIVIKMIDGEKKNENETAQKVEGEQTPEEKVASMQFMMSVVRDCLVEPSYKQLSELGIELTDAQIMSIFTYAIGSVDQLSKFC